MASIEMRAEGAPEQDSGTGRSLASIRDLNAIDLRPSTRGVRMTLSVRPFSIFNPLRGCDSDREHYFLEQPRFGPAKQKQTNEEAWQVIRLSSGA